MKKSGFLSIIFIGLLLLAVLCGCTRATSFEASVTLTGGSGRAGVESPCKVTVTKGQAYANLIWSSPNYDYMVVDGQVYQPVNTEGNSEFVIPIRLEEEMQVQADTTAMSKPHLIDYTLFFTGIDPAADAVAKGDADDEADLLEDLPAGIEADINTPPVIAGLSYLATDENRYADEFAIHRYEGGYAVLSVSDGRNYLLVPEDDEDVAGGGSAAESGVAAGDIRKAAADAGLVILTPPKHIYLAASAVMSRFDTLDRVDLIALSSLKKEDWYIDSARDAMDAGSILYGGKYSAPDYEMILKEDVDLAIESTMILHTPKVLEKLEQLGIPVLIDRSSYEADPLGRLEWIRIYGLLTGTEEKAQEAFLSQAAQVEDASFAKDLGTVAIFAVNSNHQITTRRQNDYLSKMIQKAGGTYLAPGTDDDGRSLSQATISLEAFYAYAKDADILIYNATIEEAPESIEKLVEKDALLRDFDAVKNGAVWVMEPSIYQYSDRTGTIIRELNQVLSSGDPSGGSTTFFRKLQ